MSININKDLYSNLSEAEKSIIDYISENQKYIISMSITTIAKKNNVSPPHGNTCNSKMWL